jgi:hypothetical protein
VAKFCLANVSRADLSGGGSQQKRTSEGRSFTRQISAEQISAARTSAGWIELSKGSKLRKPLRP